MSSLSDNSQPLVFLAEHKQPEIWGRAFGLARLLGVLLLASVLLNLVLVVLSVALAFKPADVIFVDQLGTATFIPSAATVKPAGELEAKAFAEIWARDFLSLDGITAKKDLSRSLSLMSRDLQKKLKSSLIESGAIDKIRQAYVRSEVDFERIEVTRSAEDRLQVSLSGTRTLTALGSSTKTLTEPFALELVLEHTDRTEQTKNGLLVRYLSGTFANQPQNFGETK